MPARSEEKEVPMQQQSLVEQAIARCHASEISFLFNEGLLAKLVANKWKMDEQARMQPKRKIELVNIVDGDLDHEYQGSVANQDFQLLKVQLDTEAEDILEGRTRKPYRSEGPHRQQN